MKQTDSEPKITVIMAAYKTRQDYFQEAIESIRNQTSHDWELIIVDDGLSIENRSYLENVNDDRILILVNEQNMGQSRSVNRALPRARGEYIARMDSDDIMAATRLERQMHYMDEHKDYVACGGLAETTDSHKIVPGLYPNDMYLRAGFYFMCDMVHPTMMLRKSSLEENEIRYDPEQLYAQDYMIWVDLLACGRVGLLEEVVLHYRVHPGQITNKKREAQDRFAARAQRKYFQNNGFETDSIDFKIHNSFVKDNLSLELSSYRFHFQNLMRQAERVLTEEQFGCFRKELAFRVFKASVRELVRGGNRKNGAALLLRYGLIPWNWPYYVYRLRGSIR